MLLRAKDSAEARKATIGQVLSLGFQWTVIPLTMTGANMLRLTQTLMVTQPLSHLLPDCGDLGLLLQCHS